MLLNKTQQSLFLESRSMYNLCGVQGLPRACGSSPEVIRGHASFTIWVRRLSASGSAEHSQQSMAMRSLHQIYGGRVHWKYENFLHMYIYSRTFMFGRKFYCALVFLIIKLSHGGYCRFSQLIYRLRTSIYRSDVCTKKHHTVGCVTVSSRCPSHCKSFLISDFFHK